MKLLVSHLIGFGRTFGHDLRLILERWIVMAQNLFEFNKFLVFCVTVAIAILADGLVNVPIFVAHAKIIVTLFFACQMRNDSHAFLCRNRSPFCQILFALFAHISTFDKRRPLLLHFHDPFGDGNVCRRLRCLNHFLFEWKQLIG